MSVVEISIEQTLPCCSVHSHLVFLESSLLKVEVIARNHSTGALLFHINLENSALVLLRSFLFHLSGQPSTSLKEIAARENVAPINFQNLVQLLQERLEKRPPLDLLLEKGILSEDDVKHTKPDVENSLFQSPTVQLPQSSPEIELLPLSPVPSKDQLYLSEAAEGLLTFPPLLCQEGIGATYFLRNKNGQVVAVFKPADEEEPSKNPKTKENNSPSSQNNSPRKGIFAGEAAVREVAAYLLDEDGFYGVPPTYMVSLRHPFFPTSQNSPKIGSLQKYVKHNCSSEDIGSSSFPVSQVHKIGILDLQIMNTDRHAGNILVREEEDDDGELQFELIPIDHGLSIPHTMDELWFEWLHWPQAKKPFDEKMRVFISKIDVEKNIEKLRSLGIREDCLRVVRTATFLLKKGANEGLSLFQIAKIATRNRPDQPSLLESLHLQTLKDVEEKEGEEEEEDDEEEEEKKKQMMEEKYSVAIQQKISEIISQS